MSKAGELISDALEEILVNQDESPEEPSDVQSAIRAMNRMIAAWNYPLGYTVVDNVDDEVTVIAAAEEAIVKNLAIRLAPQFDAIVTLDLKNAAKGALASLRRIVIVVGEASYPSRLPVGSGNQHHNRTFYPPSDAELVQEEGGSIILED